MTFVRQLAGLMVLAGGLSTTLMGCEEQGPAERAGERLDHAVEDATDAIEDAKDAVQR